MVKPRDVVVDKRLDGIICCIEYDVNQGTGYCLLCNDDVALQCETLLYIRARSMDIIPKV